MTLYPRTTERASRDVADDVARERAGRSRAHRARLGFSRCPERWNDRRRRRRERRDDRARRLTNETHRRASQVIVIDAKGHLFGRLASIVAKQLLQGQHVVRRCGGMMIEDARGRARATRARGCRVVGVMRVRARHARVVDGDGRRGRGARRGDAMRGARAG